MEFGKWCARWEDFLNERTTLISGKTTYTHTRLRTAKRSLKTHLKWLFTYEEHTEVNIPNTTNMLEGYNSQLKRALLNHNGLSDTNKKKFIDGFLNILNSAVFFLVRKFYMLRCLFGTLYVDMRCFGVSWFFSKHKIPHPNQWGILKPQRNTVYSRKTSE